MHLGDEHTGRWGEFEFDWSNFGECNNATLGWLWVLSQEKGN